MIPISQRPTHCATLGDALLNYIQKGFPIAPKWSLITGAALLALFVLLAWQVTSGAEWVTNLNAVIAGSIQSLRSDDLTAFIDLTALGSDLAITVLAVGIVAVMTIVLVVRHRWDDVLYLLGNVLVMEVLIHGAKLLCRVERPTDQFIIAAPSGTSFPSGHTGTLIMLAIVISMFVIVCFREHGLPKASAWVITALLFAYALYMGFSRIYLGVHWGTDVIGSLLLVLSWGLPTFVWFVTRYPEECFDEDDDPYGVKAIQARRAQL